ncbi:uncharacterized protein LOC143898444 isoform X1 [Temnothorax americanus]|uniref:uncharacterized protein LOC143898444 isoform X1 n=1 Tax=Temnothorax americanus TaxID=1964332 RepID=UPI00406782BB
MAISIKFTKFDNTPWGFRLAGGSDFPQPLTVIRVMEGSLAECMGLKVGDVVVRLNDQSISSLTHGQAHEALVHAGNNFVLAVQREEEARKAAEAISEENIVPYKIALADLPPVFPEQILKEETVIERYEEENTVDVVEPLSAEDEIRQEENKLAEEKPVDANSEIVPNKNLTDDEIAQLILEEEELLSDKGLLGVNFKKLRPRASILKDSKVLEELQHIAIAEPERVQELKRASTFLQKPQRPVPKSKNEPKVEEDEGETYRVVIKKQDKKTVIARLVEKGLLPPGSEATVARTPEPPEPSEVKMHETEKLEENRPPALSDSSSSCSICSLDNTDNSLSPPRPSESDSNEFLTSEDHQARHATYKCKSKLLHVKPNQSRRYSSPGRYDEIEARSLFKGRYLENVLRGYARSCIHRDRQVDEFAKTRSGSVHFRKCDLSKNIGLDGLSSSETRKRTSRCARAHYAERILLRNVSAVARHFRSKPKTTRVRASRMKGRYLATYLRHESIRLMSLITALFQFLLQRPGVSESSNLSRIHERRSSFKGRYLEHVLQKNVAPILEHVRETCFTDDQPKMIEIKKQDGPKSTRTKGRYVEKCLHRQNLRLRSALTNVFDHVKNSLDNLFVITATSSKMKRTMRGRYFERLIRRNLEILELFVEYVRSRISEWLEEGLLCTSRNEFPVITISTSNCIADDAIPNEQQTDKGILKISEWHEDGPSCPLQKESTLIINTFDNLDPNEEEIAENGCNIPESNPVSFEEPDECPDSAKPTNVVVEEEDTLSKFLQSAEDYVSTEVFHRGSRRLSKSRKSVDITAKEDDKALSKFLQSAEDYVSAEVFHRGSRRLSKSRKSVDITVKEDDKALSKFLQSAEDYVSAEVFHRGSRRLSKSRKSVDITAKEDDKALSKFLQSAEDYVSAEVFHRGSRRLSRSIKREEQEEENVLSSVLRSTGDYVSNEVFHRGSRRLSRSSRRESVSLVTLASWGGLKSMHFNLPWFSFRMTEKSSGECEEKINPEIERDNRRLSFVPTILYHGITNRIGIDVTKLAVYAFVPCTSIILLYMYK